MQCTPLRLYMIDARRSCLCIAHNAHGCRQSYYVIHLNVALNEPELPFKLATAVQRRVFSLSTPYTLQTCSICRPSIMGVPVATPKPKEDPASSPDDTLTSRQQLIMRPLTTVASSRELVSALRDIVSREFELPLLCPNDSPCLPRIDFLVGCRQNSS